MAGLTTATLETGYTDDGAILMQFNIGRDRFSFFTTPACAQQMATLIVDTINASEGHTWGRP